MFQFNQRRGIAYFAYYDQADTAKMAAGNWKALRT